MVSENQFFKHGRVKKVLHTFWRLLEVEYKAVKTMRYFLISPKIFKFQNANLNYWLYNINRFGLESYDSTKKLIPLREMFFTCL